MALYNDVNGDDIEIPSLEIKDEGEGYNKVSTVEDFALLVRCMGWSTTEEFERDTGVSAQELVGVWWLTMRNRIFVHADDQIQHQQYQEYLEHQRAEGNRPLSFAKYCKLPYQGR